MKICVIGNSHVAVLKHAYDNLPKTAATPELTFFADRGAGVNKLEVTGRKLAPPARDRSLLSAIRMTSGGHANIDPDLYDRFLLIGMAADVRQLAEMVLQPISEAARNCAIGDYWSSRAVARMVAKLKAITDKPVIYGVTPLVAAARKNNDGPAAYEKMIALSKQLFFDDMGVALVAQPVETIVNGYNTALDYARGSIRLQVKKNQGFQQHKVDELHHMNPAYGALWLKRFLAMP